jgi:hypothetical protein
MIWTAHENQSLRQAPHSCAVDRLFFHRDIQVPRSIKRISGGLRKGAACFPEQQVRRRSLRSMTIYLPSSSRMLSFNVSRPPDRNADADACPLCAVDIDVRPR